MGSLNLWRKSYCVQKTMSDSEENGRESFIGEMPKLSTLTKVQSKCSVSSVSSIRKSNYRNTVGGSRGSSRCSRLNHNIKGYLDSKDKRDSGFYAASQQNINQLRKPDMKNPDESFVGVVRTISNPYSKLRLARESLVSANSSQISRSDFHQRRHSSYDKSSSLTKSSGSRVSSRSRRNSSFSANRYDVQGSDSQALQYQIQQNNMKNLTQEEVIHRMSNAYPNDMDYVRLRKLHKRAMSTNIDGSPRRNSFGKKISEFGKSILTCSVCRI